MPDPQNNADGTDDEASGSGRCGTPSSSKANRRRRPPLMATSLLAPINSGGSTLAPPQPSTPVKSHYNVKATP